MISLFEGKYNNSIKQIFVKLSVFFLSNKSEPEPLEIRQNEKFAFGIAVIKP